MSESTPNPPADPNQPVSEKLAHQPVGARVPDRIAAGVYSTGQVVLDSPKEFVIDFLQGLTRPYRINARVIISPPTMTELIVAPRAPAMVQPVSRTPARPSSSPHQMYR